MYGAKVERPVWQFPTLNSRYLITFGVGMKWDWQGECTHRASAESVTFLPRDVCIVVFILLICIPSQDVWIFFFLKKKNAAFGEAHRQNKDNPDLSKMVSDNKSKIFLVFQKKGNSESKIQLQDSSKVIFGIYLKGHFLLTLAMHTSS